uniref:uncharacterized protein LOC132691166 n=1 Tax=Panthera onca TaxID=9690 RepID=UPI002952A58C|nr:uncharacterized protein LOC132691166 [Panthera onca]XP_060508568.1 uncharacterized protein LOC132691166 [Panthera onca]XP_060508569.1 uncharacterized protein LOC132691166 [Panthera onca]
MRNRLHAMSTGNPSAILQPWSCSNGCTRVSGPTCVENAGGLSSRARSSLRTRGSTLGRSLLFVETVEGPLCRASPSPSTSGHTPGRSPTSATSVARLTSRCHTSLSTTGCTRGEQPYACHACSKAFSRITSASTWVPSPSYAACVRKPPLRLRPLFCIRGFMPDRSPLSVTNVGKPSARADPWPSIGEFIPRRCHGHTVRKRSEPSRGTTAPPILHAPGSTDIHQVVGEIHRYGWSSQQAWNRVHFGFYLGGKMKFKNKKLKRCFYQLFVPCINSGHMVLDHVAWFEVVLLFLFFVFCFLFFWLCFVPLPKSKVYNAEMCVCHKAQPLKRLCVSFISFSTKTSLKSVKTVTFV